MNSITFARLDRLADYVPVLSTVTNLYDLFVKTLNVSRLEQTHIDSSKYYTHLNCKDARLCLTLLIPVVGNLLVAFHRWYTQNENRNEMLTAVKMDSTKIKDVSWALQADPSFIIDVVNSIGCNGSLPDLKSLFNGLPSYWLQNREVVVALLNTRPAAFELLNNNMKHYIFENRGEHWVLSQETVAELAKRPDVRELFQHFDGSEHFVKRGIAEAVLRSGRPAEELAAWVDTANAGWAFSHYLNRGALFQALPDRLKANENVVFEAALRDPGVYKLAPMALRNYESLFWRLLYRGADVRADIGDRLRQNKEFGLKLQKCDLEGENERLQKSAEQLKVELKLKATNEALAKQVAAKQALIANGGVARKGLFAWFSRQPRA